MSATYDRARALLREVNDAGGCSHPIRLQGETVNCATGELRQGTLKVPCKDRRAVVCPSCSRLYGADAWILVATGLNGGKGVPEGVSGHPRLFATLTAPSFGRVHTMSPSAPQCHPSRGRPDCRHDRPASCDLVHEPGDALLGAPLCKDCFDHRGAVLWNASSSALWDRTVVRLRRELAASQGMTTTKLGQAAQVHYLKVAELQRRGLVHFHVILRADGPGGPASDPPGWLTTGLMATTLRSVAESTYLEVSDDVEVGWGRQLDVADLVLHPGDDRRVASYLAKYVTKTTDASAALAYRFSTRGEIVRADTSPHLRDLALTAWMLGLSAELRPLRLHDHAHTLGYRGQLLTKSRGYSTTFASLRSARKEFRFRASEEDPIAGSFNYDGRGYDDPSAERLAQVFFEMEEDLRRSARASSG